MTLSEDDRDTGESESSRKEGNVNRMRKSATSVRMQESTPKRNTGSIQAESEPKRGVGEMFVEGGTEVTLQAGRLPTGERPFLHAFWGLRLLEF